MHMLNAVKSRLDKKRAVVASAVTKLTAEAHNEAVRPAPCESSYLEKKINHILNPLQQSASYCQDFDQAQD